MNQIVTDLNTNTNHTIHLTNLAKTNTSHRQNIRLNTHRLNTHRLNIHRLNTTPPLLNTHRPLLNTTPRQRSVVIVAETTAETRKRGNIENEEKEPGPLIITIKSDHINVVMGQDKQIFWM